MEPRVHGKVMKWAAVGSVLAAATILCAAPGPGPGGGGAEGGQETQHRGHHDR